MDNDFEESSISKLNAFSGMSYLNNKLEEIKTVEKQVILLPFYNYLK